MKPGFFWTRVFWIVCLALFIVAAWNDSGKTILLMAGIALLAITASLAHGGPDRKVVNVLVPAIVLLIGSTAIDEYRTAVQFASIMMPVGLFIVTVWQLAYIYDEYENQQRAQQPTE